MSKSTIKPNRKDDAISRVLDRSEEFCKKMNRSKPTTENWLEKVMKTKSFKVIGNASDLVKDSYPILHEDVVVLVEDFLKFKKAHGSNTEKKVYRGMSSSDLVQRLIAKRPLAFYGEGDKYILRNGTEGKGGWERVGTDDEGKVKMKHYMTYDEMKLAAFIQVSSPVLPINSGSRDNKGVPSAQDDHVAFAFYVGAVGARYEKKEGFMEFEETVVSRTQNTTANGYGSVKRLDEDEEREARTAREKSLTSIFAKFYKVPFFPTFEEVEDGEVTKGMAEIGDGHYMNTRVYLRRMEVTAETFLIEANHRGKVTGKKVFVHVVGLGMGVWAFSDIQRPLFMEAFQNALRSLDLRHIARIHFSKAVDFEGCVMKDGERIPLTLVDTNIVVTFGRRDPFAKLEDPSMLTVAMYAWDGNSYPGNEYWDGDLDGSGDPAAACCTQIPQLQNPYINSENICGENLRIACPSKKYGRLQSLDAK